MTARGESAPLNVFGFILTRFCVARCAHCGTSAGPEHRDVLDPTARDRCLDAIRDMELGWTVVTGGEPVARPRALRDFMDAAQRRGIRTRICSNGYWATTDERADRVLAELVELGLEYLMLSTDRFHTEFVPTEAVVRAAQAAERAGIECQIAVPALRGDLSSVGVVSDLARRTTANVFTHPVHPVGRGADLPTRVLTLDPIRVEGCGLVGYVEVDTDGTVSVCPTSADFGRASPMHLGNARRDDPVELISRYRATPWFALLHRRGPAGLAALLSAADCLPPVEPRHHACHLCRDLIDDPYWVDRYRQRTGVDLLAPASPERSTSWSIRSTSPEASRSPSNRRVWGRRHDVVPLQRGDSTRFGCDRAGQHPSRHGGRARSRRLGQSPGRWNQPR